MADAIVILESDNLGIFTVLVTADNEMEARLKARDIVWAKNPRVGRLRYHPTMVMN